MLSNNMQILKWQGRTKSNEDVWEDSHRLHNTKIHATSGRGLPVSFSSRIIIKREKQDFISWFGLRFLFSFSFFIGAKQESFLTCAMRPSKISS